MQLLILFIDIIVKQHIVILLGCAAASWYTYMFYGVPPANLARQLLTIWAGATAINLFARVYHEKRYVGVNIFFMYIL